MQLADLKLNPGESFTFKASDDGYHVDVHLESPPFTVMARVNAVADNDSLGSLLHFAMDGLRERVDKLFIDAMESHYVPGTC